MCASGRDTNSTSAAPLSRRANARPSPHSCTPHSKLSHTWVSHARTIPYTCIPHARRLSHARLSHARTPDTLSSRSDALASISHAASSSISAV